MSKKNLAVIFGGVSTEHEVSLVSSTFIIKNIDLEKYNVNLIGISKNGEWFLYNGNIENIANNSWLNNKNTTPILLSLNPNEKGFYTIDQSTKQITFYPIDIIFPVLHGRNGEDGSIQGLFEMANIPYVGCNYLSSGICMDKEFTHIILKHGNISISPWLSLTKLDFENSNFDFLEKIYNHKLNYPMFVKPANAGSSVGISKVKDKNELKIAIDKAFKIDSKIIIEKYIKGKEIECAVIGNTELFASVLGEISPGNDFYDYDAKYNNDNSLLYIPARISNEISNQIREIAKKAFKLLGCSGMSRVDFFLTDDNEIILNEINTIPGFTAISMYPKLLMKSGIDKKEIINKLLDLGFELYNENLQYNKL